MIFLCSYFLLSYLSNQNKQICFVLLERFTRMDRWALSKIRGKFKATLGLSWLHLHLAWLLVTLCFGSTFGLWGILFLILSASVLPSQQLRTCSDNYVSAFRLIHPVWVFQASVCVFWKFSQRGELGTPLWEESWARRIELRQGSGPALPISCIIKQIHPAISAPSSVNAERHRRGGPWL